VRDLLDHTALAGLAYAVRQLGDDDRALATAQLLDVRAAAHRDAAAARSIRVPNAAAPDDRPAGRKIGALDVLRQALDVDRGVLDHGNDSVDHLTEVVRWHVRRHADRDPGRTV